MKSKQINATGNSVQDTGKDRDINVPVSPERWREAQAWELEFWNRQNIPPAWWKRLLRPLLVLFGLRPRLQHQEYDDRNRWWMKQFNGYRDLPLEFNNVCELGCGPYTNIRLIREGRHIRYAHCSDPLAAHYIQYEKAWLGHAHRGGIVSVDFHPAENCPFRTGFFDCTIFINVLDHVLDAKKCLEEALRITKPGGFFVFGQDLTGPDDARPDNPGHPFFMTCEQIEPILDSACDRVFRCVVERGAMSEPDMHYGALAYIGRKR